MVSTEETVNKIKQVVNRSDFNDVIEQIVNYVILKGCRIQVFSIRASKHQFTDPCMICLTDRCDEPSVIIWDLLHEFGHHLSGKKAEGDLELHREELAWDYADVEFLKYPILEIERESYERYKFKCLNSYRENF